MLEHLPWERFDSTGLKARLAKIKGTGQLAWAEVVRARVSLQGWLQILKTGGRFLPRET